MLLVVYSLIIKKLAHNPDVGVQIYVISVGKVT